MIKQSQSAAQRGAADAYYGRSPEPHRWNARGRPETNLSKAEVREYMAAYHETLDSGDTKQW